MRARPSPRRDHPRVCGEHPHKAIADSGFPGSSPRVRGTRCSFRRGTRTIGIIPACAGNTVLLCGHFLLLRDHPRVCGEHRRLAAARRSTRGSSPRVRGTPALIVLDYATGGIIPACAGNTHGHDVRGGLRGIIPACAGNTTGSFPPAWCRWDHPRVCGEHVFTIPGHIPAWGSSPRVRGTLPTHVGMIP